MQAEVRAEVTAQVRLLEVEAEVRVEAESKIRRKEVTRVAARALLNMTVQVHLDLDRLLYVGF